MFVYLLVFARLALQGSYKYYVIFIDGSCYASHIEYRFVVSV